MFTLYLSLVLLAVIFILYLYATRNFKYWESKNVVGPVPVPLFGNIVKTAFRQEYIGDETKEIYNQYPNEKVVGIYRMMTPSLLVRDLDIVKAVMIKDFDAFTDRGVQFSAEGLGLNMFHADGETWKVLRSSFSPLFSTGKIKNMSYLIFKYADRQIKYLEHNTGESAEVNIKELTRNFTIAAIAATAFGMDIEINDSIFEKILRIDTLIFESHIAPLLDMAFPGILKKMGSSLFPKQVKDFFSDVVRAVVKQRNGEPIGRNDFMDLILAMRKEGQISKTTGDNKTTSLSITDDVIAAQAFLFFVAGYETSATTTTFLLYELAMNPDVQDKVRAEVDKVIEDTNGNVTYETLIEVPYLGRVFDETLRKHTIVDALGTQRVALRDYKVPGTDLTIPKGMMVVVSPSGIHGDEKYYPNPDVFDPDRFLPENAKNRHSCAFMAFGVGPRNCIGMRLARVQVMMFVIKLLSKFRIEPSEKTPSPKELKFNKRRLLRTPDGDLYLRFVKRN